MLLVLCLGYTHIVYFMFTILRHCLFILQVESASLMNVCVCSCELFPQHHRYCVFECMISTSKAECIPDSVTFLVLILA